MTKAVPRNARFDNVFEVTENFIEERYWSLWNYIEQCFENDDTLKHYYCTPDRDDSYIFKIKHKK